MKPIETITRESFAPFGTVLEFSAAPQSERFEVLVEEANSPWRLAVYRVRERACTTLENHPASLESFEPLSGTGLLLVAENAVPAAYRVFLLNKPVCLHKGVWHQMLTLSEETIVKITENLEVSALFYTLPQAVTAAVL